MESAIRKAVRSFIGVPLKDLESEKILQSIRKELGDEAFNASVTISGNLITVAGFEIDCTVKAKDELIVNGGSDKELFNAHRARKIAEKASEERKFIPLKEFMEYIRIESESGQFSISKTYGDYAVLSEESRKTLIELGFKVGEEDLGRGFITTTVSW